MTETTTRTGRVGKGLRRAGALTAAAGLLLAGVLMGGPAVAAAAESAAPIAVAELAPVSDSIAVPVIEEGVAEPVEQIVEAVTRPVGMSIFLASALTIGAGGIATARVLAHRRHAEAARVRD